MIYLCSWGKIWFDRFAPCKIFDILQLWLVYDQVFYSTFQIFSIFGAASTLLGMAMSYLNTMVGIFILSWVPEAQSCSSSVVQPHPWELSWSFLLLSGWLWWNQHGGQQIASLSPSNSQHFQHNICLQVGMALIWVYINRCSNKWLHCCADYCNSIAPFF